MSPRRRVGILGGTFDPIHSGHVDLAAFVARAIHLDEVRLLANNAPPHKPPAVANAFHRHAMLALASAGTRDVVPDPIELEREGVSYTIDTLARLEAVRPQDQHYLLVGADSLRDLHSWRRWREILDRAIVVSTGRSGVDLGVVRRERAEEIAAGRVIVVDHEPPPWSSTSLRQDLAAGRAPPEGALTEAVGDYIRKNELYGTATPPAPAPETHA
jgi:nicotinate-nucleotide adenylyltransferase